jgi:putative flippase GtrA
LTSRFAHFLAAGGVSVAANFGSRFLYSLVLAYEYAIVTAHITGMMVAFVLMRRYVFNADRGKPGKQIFWFVGVNLLSMAQTLVISLALVRWALPLLGIERHAEAIAHFFGLLTTAVTSYFWHKLLTFK